VLQCKRPPTAAGSPLFLAHSIHNSVRRFRKKELTQPRCKGTPGVVFNRFIKSLSGSRPLEIPKVMKLRTLTDVRELLGHLPKETRARDTWQHVETELTKAAAGADPMQVYVALQMVLQLERVEYESQ
jgi:hypothetical protein